jgi:hypothetical protein
VDAGQHGAAGGPARAAGWLLAGSTPGPAARRRQGRETRALPLKASGNLAAAGDPVLCRVRSHRDRIIPWKPVVPHPTRTVHAR